MQLKIKTFVSNRTENILPKQNGLCLLWRIGYKGLFLAVLAMSLVLPAMALQSTSLSESSPITRDEFIKQANKFDAVTKKGWRELQPAFKTQKEALAKMKELKNLNCRIGAKKKESPISADRNLRKARKRAAELRAELKELSKSLAQSTKKVDGVLVAPYPIDKLFDWAHETKNWEFIRCGSCGRGSAAGATAYQKLKNFQRFETINQSLKDLINNIDAAIKAKPQPCTGKNKGKHAGKPIKSTVKDKIIGMILEGDGTKTSAVLVQLTNNTDCLLTVLIRQGDAFIPNSSAYQIMMATSDVVVTVPAGKTVSTAVPTVCSSSKTDLPPPPAGSGVAYTPGDYPNAENYRHIRDILATAAVLNEAGAFDELPIPAERRKHTIGQTAIWMALGLETLDVSDDVTPETIKKELLDATGSKVSELSENQNEKIDKGVDSIFAAVDLTLKHARKAEPIVMAPQALDNSAGPDKPELRYGPFGEIIHEWGSPASPASYPLNNGPSREMQPGQNATPDDSKLKYGPFGELIQEWG